jgi:hypothetical protein
MKELKMASYGKTHYKIPGACMWRNSYYQFGDMIGVITNKLPLIAAQIIFPEKVEQDNRIKSRAK